MDKKIIQIVETKNVDSISLVYVQAVAMPNGEFICNGRSIGFKNDIIKFFIEANFD